MKTVLALLVVATLCLYAQAAEDPSKAAQDPAKTASGAAAGATSAATAASGAGTNAAGPAKDAATNPGSGGSDPSKPKNMMSSMGDTAQKFVKSPFDVAGNVSFTC